MLDEAKEKIGKKEKDNFKKKRQKIVFLGGCEENVFI